MDAKIRAFLRSKGVPEETINKIEQGDDMPDDPEERLAKIAPDSLGLAKICECNTLLEKIRESLDRILKADAGLAAAARGVELFTKGERNGHTIDLPDFLKGLRP